MDFDDSDDLDHHLGDAEAARPDPLREALEQPLRRKARDIAHLAHALVSSLSSDLPVANEDLLLEHTKTYLLENAYLLGAKLANAYAGTDYGHRLEMAVLIKRAAVELLTQTSALRAYASTVPGEYLAALRADVEEFRQLFVPWVASFDRTDFYDDGWGLFDRLLP